MRNVLSSSTRVGLISDTHGLLRPEAIQFLSGSQLIIHCGDICGPDVLTELGRIAPVTAVRGNNDQGPWAAKLAEYELVAMGRSHAYVIHDLSQMDIEPISAGVGVVLSGHSHKPYIERRGGVLYVNPGSAGPRRFKLPISVAELIVEDDSVTARLFDLEHNRYLDGQAES
jgi:putative phosphoesterase